MLSLFYKQKDEEMKKAIDFSPDPLGDE